MRIKGTITLCLTLSVLTIPAIAQTWTPVWDGEVLCFREDALYHIEVTSVDYGRDSIRWESDGMNVQVYSDSTRHLENNSVITYSPGEVITIFAGFDTPQAQQDTVTLYIGEESLQLPFRMLPKDSISRGRMVLSTGAAVRRLRMQMPKLDLPEVKLLNMDNELVEVIRSTNEYLDISHLEPGSYQLVTPLDTYVVQRIEPDSHRSNSFTREEQ